MTNTRWLLAAMLLVGACGSGSVANEDVGDDNAAATVSSTTEADAAEVADASESSTTTAPGESASDTTEEPTSTTAADETAEAGEGAGTVELAGYHAEYCEAMANSFDFETAEGWVTALEASPPPELEAVIAEFGELMLEIDAALDGASTEEEYEEVRSGLDADAAALVDELEVFANGDQLDDGLLGTLVAAYESSCHPVAWSDAFFVTTVAVAPATSEAEIDWPLSRTVDAIANDSSMCLEGDDRAAVAAVFGDNASVTVADTDGTWKLSVEPVSLNGFRSVACAISIGSD